MVVGRHGVRVWGGGGLGKAHRHTDTQNQKNRRKSEAHLEGIMGVFPEQKR